MYCNLLSEGWRCHGVRSMGHYILQSSERGMPVSWSQIDGVLYIAVYSYVL